MVVETMSIKKLLKVVETRSTKLLMVAETRSTKLLNVAGSRSTKLKTLHTVVIRTTVQITLGI